MGVLSPPDHTTEVSPPATSRFRSPLLQREMPGLDILRGVAVLAVVMYHGLHWWLPPALSLSRGTRILYALTGSGWLGVNLFFVLSGFLITGILLDTRTRPNYWKSFYTRRVLRILPLYLVTLLLLHFYEGLSWTYLLVCLVYLANFAPAMHLFGYGPLWSLAVEEQFYLVWPLLVRRLRLRTLAWLCVASVVVSPILRYLSASKILPLGDPYAATWFQTDGLAVGGLTAILLRTRLATPARVRTLTFGLLALSAMFFAVGLSLHIMARSTAQGAAFHTEPFLLLFASMLLFALQYGARPLVYRLTAPLRFFGYLSYGLYLLHLIGFKVYEDLFTSWTHPSPLLTLALTLRRFAVVLAVVSLVCYLSRRYFEEFFLRLKDRLVPYTSPKSATPTR